MNEYLLNLQLFAEEGGEMAGADSGSTDLASPEAGSTDGVGVAATSEGTETAPVQEESWESLIKGKYKTEYGKAVKDAVNKRMKNQANLQGQFNAIDPMVRALAEQYKVASNPDGSIPIQQLVDAFMNDSSRYEEEAFQRGMSVEDYKQLRTLERENAQLKASQQQTERQREWDELVSQAESMKELYPSFDLETEMEDPSFGRLLVTMQKSGFKNPVQTAYEAVHREELMSGAMQYAVQRTNQKISNSIQSGMRRPAENGTRATTPGTATGLDPSKLTKAQIEDIKSRAARGERIVF